MLKTYTFYMKSGNKIVIDNLAPFEITYEGNTITKISGVDSNHSKVKLWVASLDLSQIEAITIEEPSFWNIFKFW